MMKASDIYKHETDIANLSAIQQLFFTIKGSSIKNDELLKNDRKCMELFSGYLLSETKFQEFMSQSKNEKGCIAVRINNEKLIKFINDRTGCTLNYEDVADDIIENSIKYINTTFSIQSKHETIFKSFYNNGCRYISINVDVIKDRIILPVAMPEGYKNLELNCFNHYQL